MWVKFNWSIHSISINYLKVTFSLRFAPQIIDHTTNTQAQRQLIRFKWCLCSFMLVHAQWFSLISFFPIPGICWYSLSSLSAGSELNRWKQKNSKHNEMCDIKVRSEKKERKNKWSVEARHRLQNTLYLSAIEMNWYFSSDVTPSLA